MSLVMKHIHAFVVLHRRGRIDKSEKTCENRMVAQHHRAAPKNKEV